MLKEKIIVLISLAVSLIITTSYISKTKGVNDELVRLHIIANSDSEEDQKIKMNVKEKVEKYFEENLNNIRSTEEILKKVNNKKAEIIMIANEECNEKYKCKLKITTEKFPMKVCNGKIIEQGYYNAIKIIIGEGIGHNWWQALYPELSFTDESYRLIEDKGTDEIEYKVSFKIFEIIQKYKNKKRCTK